MFAFGRKKKTNQVTAVNFGAILGEEVSRPKSPNPEIKELVDPYVMAREQLFLNVFAMDYVTFNRYGDSPMKKAILDRYYRVVSQNVRLDDMNIRIQEYAVAIQTPPPNSELDQNWVFGKSFARFCERENDAYVITMGILLLRNAVNHITNLYQQFEVVD